MLRSWGLLARQALHSCRAQKFIAAELKGSQASNEQLCCCAAALNSLPLTSLLHFQRGVSGSPSDQEDDAEEDGEEEEEESLPAPRVPDSAKIDRQFGLPISGFKPPKISNERPPGATLLGIKGEILLQKLEATAQEGGIGAAVSDAVGRLGYQDEESGAEGPTSAERFDEVLEEWESKLEEGDYDGVMRLMGRELGINPTNILEPMRELHTQKKEEVERGRRRRIEESLKETFLQKRVRTVDELGRAYATGKRKTSVARVWLKEPPEARRGLGRVTVNGRPVDDYFKPILARMELFAPFEVTSTLGKFDVRATVTGGGTSGQSQAIRHGIAKALQFWDPELRPPLKSSGYLTRDNRIVERKKPGKAKARKSFQWVKR